MIYDVTTPFDFARLEGQPEPESWGPAYNIKRRRGQSVGDAVREAHAALWKRDPVFHTNSPSGQAFEFSAAKHRAKLKAEFTAKCNAERRAWADASAYKGSPKWTAYEEAMTAKRAREHVQAGYLSPRDAFREAVNTNVVTAKRKPHYVYRAGEWKLAA